MSKVLCTKEKLVAIADSIRDKLNIENTMTLDQMKTYIDSIPNIPLIGIPISYVNTLEYGANSIQAYGFNESGELGRINITNGNTKTVYFPYAVSGTANLITIYTPLMIYVPKTPYSGGWANTKFEVDSTMVIDPRLAVYGTYEEDRYLYLDLNIDRMSQTHMEDGDYTISQIAGDIPN